MFGVQNYAVEPLVKGPYYVTACWKENRRYALWDLLWEKLQIWEKNTASCFYGALIYEVLNKRSFFQPEFFQWLCKRRGTDRVPTPLNLWLCSKIHKGIFMYLTLLTYIMQIWGNPSNSTDGEPGKPTNEWWTRCWGINLQKRWVACANIGHDSWCDPRHLRRVLEMWDGWLCIKTLRGRESLSSSCQVLQVLTYLGLVTKG